MLHGWIESQLDGLQQQGERSCGFSDLLRSRQVGRHLREIPDSKAVVLYVYKVRIASDLHSNAYSMNEALLSGAAGDLRGSYRGNNETF